MAEMTFTAFLQSVGMCLHVLACVYYNTTAVIMLSVVIFMFVFYVVLFYFVFPISLPVLLVSVLSV